MSRREATGRDCEDGPRPCPFLTCRYHLASEEESCALDVAERGRSDFATIARLMGVAPVTSRRVFYLAVKKMQRRAMAARAAAQEEKFDATEE